MRRAFQSTLPSRSMRSVSGSEDGGSARPGAIEHPFWQRARPPSLVIEEVRAIWAAIADGDDWTRLERTVDELRTMGLAMAGRFPGPAET